MITNELKCNLIKQNKHEIDNFASKIKRVLKSEISMLD
jgi:hypothetical protein